MERSRSVPAAAAWLGGLGLIPFAAGAISIVFFDLAWASYALRSYAAIILSFMGGVQWGLAIADHGAEAGRGPSWARLGWSVVPALIAWIAVLLPALEGYLVIALAFAILLVGDLLAVRKGLAPAWYPWLRVPLTTVVIICLVAAALG